MNNSDCSGTIRPYFLSIIYNATKYLHQSVLILVAYFGYTLHYIIINIISILYSIHK